MVRRPLSIIKAFIFFQLDFLKIQNRFVQCMYQRASRAVGKQQLVDNKSLSFAMMSHLATQGIGKLCLWSRVVTNASHWFSSPAFHTHARAHAHAHTHTRGCMCALACFLKASLLAVVTPSASLTLFHSLSLSLSAG